MNKKVSILVLVGLILLLVFTVMGGQALAEKQATVPFKATYQTFPKPLGVNEDGYLMLEISADGNGTHLGKSEWYADSLVLLGQPNPTIQTGEMVFTAANGDQLIGSFEGLANLDPGGAEFWGEYEITEGTGRFVGATGSGEYYGSAGAETGTLTFEGTLTNP